MIFCFSACSESTLFFSKNIIATIPTRVNKIWTKNILKILNYRLKQFRSINCHFWVVVCLQIHIWMWGKRTKSGIFVCWEDLQLRVLRDFFLFKVFPANWANELRGPCTSLLSRILQVFPGLWLLLSFPQWDYAAPWRGWGGLGFPSDHIRNGSLLFLHRLCSFSSSEAKPRLQEGLDPRGGLWSWSQSSSSSFSVSAHTLSWFSSAWCPETQQPCLVTCTNTPLRLNLSSGQVFGTIVHLFVCGFLAC